MSSFKQALLESLVNYHDYKKPEREDGLHASMSGKCPRHVLANYMNTDRKPYPFTIETKGIFTIGHMFDEWCKLACESGFLADKYLYPIMPFRCETEFGGLKIVGEMDLPVLDLKTSTLHIVDFKSIGESQFGMQKRDNHPKPMHSLQVACYMQSWFVKTLCHGAELDCVGWVVYVSKGDMQLHMVKVPMIALEQCEKYWLDIADCLREGNVPQAANDYVMVPTEPWECGYCNMYPLLNAAKFGTKTAMKQARAALQASNLLMCMTEPYERLGLAKGKPVALPIDDVTDEAPNGEGFPEDYRDEGEADEQP